MTTITANVPLLGGVYDIAIEKDKIASVTETDCRTDICAGPTLFDIQVNGYGGRTCQISSAEKKDALAHITKTFRGIGVGWWIPTVCCASRDSMAAAFKYCGEALDEDPDLQASVPGLHMEGPYISEEEGWRGTYLPEEIRPPDWDEFQQLQELSGGRIKYITLAPEIEGAGEFIRKCADAGVVVSVGHSNLTRDALQLAVDSGATMSTHLGNGAADMIQRHNNHVWYQLACRDTFASFISDGHHLPQECLYSMIHAKGLGRSLITSDCVSLGGMEAGIYGPPGRQVEKLPSGRINLVGTPNLAGSANNLLECTETVIRMAKLSHAEGWELASTQPAKALGLDARLGVAPGKEATLTVYRYDENGPTIHVLETWVAGQKVFDRSRRC